jgi:putative ABC transport system substrate-binding protein
MQRREFITLVGGAAAVWPLSASAQQPDKVYRIGLFFAGSDNTSRKTWSALTDGLRKLGWIEGKNILFERKFADNQLNRLPELAEELVRLNVDVIVTGGTLAPLAAKRATATIPIVIAAAGDPVGTKLVASLAQPGGNVTGLSLMTPDVAGKRLELLKEVVPQVSRVGIFWNGANPYPALVFRETERAAQKVGIQVISLEVRGPTDFDRAFEAAIQQRTSALISVEDPLTIDHRKQIADFAVTNRLPSMHGQGEFVRAGGLMSYGADTVDVYRRAAVYVDKIFRGAKPADLPVEQPVKFELVINLKTAKALGLTVPPALLARADEVIE